MSAPWLARQTVAGRGATVAVALVIASAVASCGSRSPSPTTPAIEVPDRGSTSGDAILAMVPAGADSIFELDLERLRANAAVGALFQLLTAPGGEASATNAGGVNLLTTGDLVVFVSYNIGDDDMERLVIVRGAGADAIEGAYRLDDDTVAIASGAMQKRLALVAAGQEPAMTGASTLLRLRALAMPERAPGAALRLSAHLDFNARVALARALDVDEVPVAVSVWGDVADDLAVVALVSGQTSKEGQKLSLALESIRSRLSAVTPVRRLGLSRLVRGATIENQGAAARMVLLIGPRRLKRLVKRILSRLREQQGAA